MLETGNYAQAAHANGKEGTMTAIEYKTEFSMWAIAASPLVVTTPIMNCTSPPAPPVTSCKVQLVNKVGVFDLSLLIDRLRFKGARRIGYL